MNVQPDGRWKAIINLYNLTNDPIYLAAAKKIIAVPLREQKSNGAWPHRLPKDHARGKTNAYGNNIFLIGVLLSGMKDYHQATGDPKTKKALLDGVDWVCKSYDAKSAGWPYSALTDGTPLGHTVTGLNMLIIDSIAYAANITGKKKYADVARGAITSRIVSGPGASGKNMAQVKVMSDSIIYNLSEYYRKNDPKNARNIVSNQSVALTRGNIPDRTKFYPRSPDNKILYIKLKKANPTISLIRKKHGARPDGWDTCNVTIFNATGKKVFNYKYKPNAEFTKQIKLTGSKGSVFKAVFHDDMRGICDVYGKDIQVMLELVKGTTLGRIASSRFYLTVPKGTKKFTVNLQGIHTGPYGMMVLQANGKIAGLAEGINTGRCLLPWSVGVPNVDSTKQQLMVKVPSGQDGKIWPLILWGSGDVGLQVKGIPPYLTRQKQTAFKVK